MGNIARETLILRAIYGISFLKYVLQENNYTFDSGYLLVAKDSKSAIRIVQNIKRWDDSIFYRNWNTQSTYPLNYEVGILFYNRYIKEAAICDFLHQEDFLPLVIVDGIVPEFLRAEYFIIPIEISESTSSNFLDEYRAFKTFILENLEYVMREITLFETDILYNNKNVLSYNISLYRTLGIVGKVWKLYERNKLINEQICEWNYKEYIALIIELLNVAERFEDDYDIREAIRNVVISYVEKNFILIVDTTQITNQIQKDMEQKQVILQDLRYYYFPEKLFEKICAPLTKNVSFLQLKHEMFKDNILICDGSKQKNYTIKKMYYNPDTCESHRMRFLKFPKDIFETNEGMSLEMIVNTNPKTNIVKIFSPKGGKLTCKSK